MMLKLLSFLLVSLVSVVKLHGAPGETLSTEELKELQARLNQRQDLSVSFEQVRTSALRPKKPSKSSGNAFFSKPAKFRWELEKPQADILIYDGKNLFSFKPGDKTATRYKTEGDRAKEIREIIDFVLDFDQLLKRYNLMESTKIDHAISLVMKPKNQSAISELVITINQKDYFVQSIKMQFQNKNNSEFIFKNPSGRKIEGKTFTVPAGLTVVDGF